MTNSKATKFFLYAIGEVMLVVIGILIALQIDNWNERRKREKLELSLLSELIQNLHQDIDHMKTNIFIYNRAITSISTILTVFENRSLHRDSLNKHYGNVLIAPKFLPTQSSYQSIRDEGIRLIRNDSLRYIIVRQYDEHYNFLTALSDEEWSNMFEDTRDVYRRYFMNFDLYGDVVPIDFEDLRRNNEYLSYLNNRLGWMRLTVGVYNDRIMDSERLISMIEKELRQRKKQ